MLQTVGVLLARLATWPQLAAIRIGLALWARRNPGILPPMRPCLFGDSIAAAIALAFLMAALGLRRAVALVPGLLC